MSTEQKPSYEELEARVKELEEKMAGKVMFAPAITKVRDYYCAGLNARHVAVGFGRTPEEALAERQAVIDPKPAAPQEEGKVTP